MDAARAARLVEHVFAHAGPVYALLDAARDERVYDAVRTCGRPCEPLYDGKLPPELAEVAPYLVELAADHPFTEQLLAEGWGDSWGCFLSAPVDLRGLRRHLRRFLKVRTENRKTLVFRYYDPRVLRVYLPTCTTGELDTFFGPIERFLVEDDGGRAALAFGRSAGTLAVTRLELQAPA